MTENKQSFDFLINGFEVNASYSQESIDNIFLPLVNEWYEMFLAKQEKLIIFLAAPPAVGKSTLAELLVHLFKKTIKSDISMQAIGIDGFHYHQSYLKNNSIKINGQLVPMTSVKGSPETYDFGKLKTKLEELKKANSYFPFYDRNLHDVVEDNIFMDAQIVLVEGNWLLLNEEPWKNLINLCDYSVFIEADLTILKDRLINRKMKGGLTYEQALAFFKGNDSVNVIRVLENHLEPDMHLIMDEKENYIKWRNNYELNK